MRFGRLGRETGQESDRETKNVRTGDDVNVNHCTEYVSIGEALKGFIVGKQLEKS
jgi:hypothetical protein